MRRLFPRRSDDADEVIPQVSDDDLLSWGLDLLTISPTEPMALRTSRPERPLRAGPPPPRRVRVRQLRATATD
jgi:hypothetical protein